MNTATSSSPLTSCPRARKSTVESDDPRMLMLKGRTGPVLDNVKRQPRCARSRA